MALPWLRILDMLIGVTDVARVANLARGPEESSARRQKQLEVDREAQRLDLERQLLEAERLREERALRLALLRQAGDREIGRLRLLSGVAVATWIGTLVFSVRLIGGSIGARVLLGFGWLFLLCAIAVSFIGQSSAASAVDALASSDDNRGAFRSSASGAFALWLIIVGLVFAGLAALIV